MTTKEQERQAIQKIRKIIEGLGENSYVGTAMEGVLEIADQNIEFDAAFSLKAQAEIAEEQLKKADAENMKLKELLGTAGKTAEELRSKLTEAQSMAERRYMPDAMREKVVAIVSERKTESERNMMDAANRMADGVGENGNTSQGMAQWAAEYKENRKERVECANLLRMLKRYEDKEDKKDE